MYHRAKGSSSQGIKNINKTEPVPGNHSDSRDMELGALGAEMIADETAKALRLGFSIHQ